MAVDVRRLGSIMSDIGIYVMKLHSQQPILKGEILVTRVPGGWLYTSYRYIARSEQVADWEPFSTVFVPFNNEFQS